MEALIITAMASQIVQRAYYVASSVYEAVPKSTDAIVIEITAADGKTSSKEVIKPKTSFPSPITYLLDTVSYHLHTIWLFTYSDARTVLVPWTLFGIVHALSASFFGLSIQPSTLSILSRIPQIMLWTYLNLLPFTIGNQNTDTAIVEDAVNKPWRPLPSKRLTSTSAHILMVAAYIIALIFSLRYGGASQCIILAILGYIHNDCGGGDKSWILRNGLNGLGFISFGSGAMEVAMGRSFSYTPALTQWLRLIALVVFVGIQVQDMYDQAGDALVKRVTLPLVIGDQACRHTIALSTIVSSIVCASFCGSFFLGYALTLSLAILVATRTMTKKTVADDRKTYKLWNVWLLCIYCLPMIKVLVGPVF